MPSDPVALRPYPRVISNCHLLGLNLSPSLPSRPLHPPPYTHIITNRCPIPHLRQLPTKFSQPLFTPSLQCPRHI